MAQTYKFSCGCEFKILADSPIEGGSPLLDFDVDRDVRECSATFELLKKGLGAGIFQIESNFASGWCKKLAPNSLSEIADLVALLRPGCLQALDPVDGKTSMTSVYCKRKNNEIPVRVDFPAIQGILAKTFQVLIYQEQQIKIGELLAGYSKAEADTKLRKCLSGDTEFVSKTRGWISIKDLIAEGYQDDEFLIMDENGVQSWKKIINIWSNGVKKVKKITTRTGSEITATDNHQFLTSSGWKECKDLQAKKDWCVTTFDCDYEGDKTSIDEYLAFVIAGLICEGYFVDHTSHFTNFDLEMMGWFCEKLYLSPLKAFPVFHSNGKEKKVCRIHKENRDKIAKFMAFGKSAIKFIPKEMMRANKESVRKFLSFMLACEGGINKTTSKYFQFTSKSRKLVLQVRKLLKLFGIYSYLGKKLNPTYGYFYNVNVPGKLNLINLQRELTRYWNKEKKDDLQFIINYYGKVSDFQDKFPHNIVHKLIFQYPIMKRYGCGSLYKGDVSRRRLKELANRSDDPKLHSFLNGKQFYEQIKEIVDIGEEEVFDFTMEDSSTPYIIANGFVAHNSIGKKDANALTKLEEDFISNCNKVGLVTEQEARKIFGWIKAAARYSFNSSHSASYAIRTLKTAFLKAHFPLAFFKSKLQSAKDRSNVNSLGVGDFINDARLFNIFSRVPDFRDLKETFYIKDKTIYFGLKDIKGFGESTFKALTTSIDSFPDKDNLKNYTWNELLIKFLIQYKAPQEGKTGTPPRLISESVVDSLIKAGAFSYFGKSRSELLAYYGLFSYLTHTDLKYLNGMIDKLNVNDMDSFLLAVGRLVKDGGIFKSQPRLAGFHDEIKSFNSKKLTDSPLWVTFCEDSLLGVPITCQKIDSYDTTEANMTLKAFITGGNSDYAVYACDIEDAQERTLTKGKNAGEVWASIILSDGTAKLSVAVWPEDYRRWSALLYKGNSVIIRGERGKGKYKDNLEIKQIEQAKAPTTHLESINEEYDNSQLTTVEF